MYIFMKKDLITIVTVCFNAENVIRKTMTSVLEQTYSPIEYRLTVSQRIIR